MTPIVTLRVSVARVAQSLNVDNELEVTGKSYEELVALAETEEHGWNNLCALCVEKGWEVAR